MHRVIRPRSLPLLAPIVVLAAAATPLAAQVGDCPASPPTPVGTTVIRPFLPCAGEDVYAFVSTCGPCWDLLGAELTSSGIVARVVARRAELCALRAGAVVCEPESIAVPLGRFQAGRASIRVRYEATVVRRDSIGADSLVCAYVVNDTLEFTVRGDCSPPGVIPHLATVWIGRDAPCNPCPPVVCAGDSIPVYLRGAFPDDCISLLGVELIERPTATPIPGPPLVRILYGRNDCVRRPCIEGPFPWAARVVLPPLPDMNVVQSLPVEALRLDVPCQGPPDSTFLGEAFFPFVVADTCSLATRDCFLAGFDVEPNAPGRCDRLIGPDRPARVVYRIGSTVNLHGLQGAFTLDPPHLRIASIEAVGAAAGMRLLWRAEPGGGRFVLFSDGDAFIPAAPPLPASARVPILAIRVEAPTPLMTTTGDRVTMRARELLGSDRGGRGIETCPIAVTPEPPDQEIVFCPAATCDITRDGIADVRDLVWMVRCLRDSTLRCDVAPADCDVDGDFDLGDVFCCARAILQGGARDTTTARADGSIRVAFEVPAAEGDVRLVRAVVTGDHPIAGARIAFRFPDERYRLAGVTFPDAPEWLALHEDRGDGRVDVGLIDLAGHTSRALRLEMTLRLERRPGADDGGAVTLEEAEFADPEGTALIASLGAPSVSLAPVRGLALSAGSPNPFARTLGFTVALERAGDLEVVVLDLTGRRIATLHRGAAAAGVHPFTWDGRGADGGPAPDGIYFVRARALGEDRATKAIRLRAP